jgi:hypothetical protein
VQRLVVGQRHDGDRRRGDHPGPAPLQQSCHFVAPALRGDRHGEAGQRADRIHRSPIRHASMLPSRRVRPNKLTFRVCQGWITSAKINR